MDALAQIYKVQWDEAASLAQQGDVRAALDILYHLRLKPDLGIYRRALVSPATSHNIFQLIVLRGQLPSFNQRSTG